MKPKITREQFLQSMDALVELPVGTLQGPESLNALAGWNSLAIIGFIALADSVTGTPPSVTEIMSCSTVDDLLRIVKLED